MITDRERSVQLLFLLYVLEGEGDVARNLGEEAELAFIDEAALPGKELECTGVGAFSRRARPTRPWRLRSRFRKDCLSRSV
jgi:hypothetical protein